MVVDVMGYCPSCVFRQFFIDTVRMRAYLLEKIRTDFPQGQLRQLGHLSEMANWHATPTVHGLAGDIEVRGDGGLTAGHRDNLVDSEERLCAGRLAHVMGSCESL